MRKIVLIYLVVFSLISVVPLIARAYNVPNIWPTGYWATDGLISCTGNYLSGSSKQPCRSLCDLIQTAINIIYFVMTIAIFVLTPVFFAVGAIMIMVAGAKPDMLETGKKTLTGTVIGLVIVLCSYLIINTFITVLGITGIGGFNGSACSSPSGFVADPAASLAMQVLPLPGVALAQTQIQISTSIPATNPQGNSPGGFVANFYQFALMISGVLALGAVVYGGIKYVASAGNPSAQHEGKEWVQSALLGLLLLAGAYLILNIVNPDLVKLDMLNNLNLQTVSIAGGGGGGGDLSTATGGLTSAVATQALQDAGISIKPGVSVDGMQQATVSDLQNLASQCAQANGGNSCNMVITGGTDGGHAVSACSHDNGYKADLRSQGNTALNNFITSQPVVGVRSDGATLYAYGGGVIADERNLPGVAAHWDLSAPCPL